jgi:regulator of protease activity HflC (stomatin/prohibitin superfamily)
MSSYLCLAIVLVIGIFSILSRIQVVPEYQRLVVFRLGRFLDRPKGPGIVFLIPVIDRALKVDLREQKREISNQEATTKDFIPVSFDLDWYYRILDPIKAVTTVGNAETAMAAFIIMKLRSEIKEINSANLSSEFTRLNNEFHRNDHQLPEISEKFGMKVSHFEILKLAIDDHKKEMDDAKITVGTFGETQTTVHTSGTVIIGEQAWSATSNSPIAPKTKVRVKSVILEIEESS